MQDYHCAITIHAPAQKVYEAITTQRGIQNWWTNDCHVETKHRKATMRFGKTYNVMAFEKLSNTEVRWRCIAQHQEFDKPLTKKDEWVGTHVIFLIKELDPDHTELHFTHKGLLPSLECFDICKKGWDHFIKTSLKNYLEKGKGQPFQSAKSE